MLLKTHRTAVDEWRENWPLALVSMLGMSIAGINFYSQGLFMGPLQAEFGWSRAEVTLGPTVHSILTALTVAASGWIIDRVGPRIIAIIGVCAFSLSFAALALTQGAIWQWLAFWVVLAFTFPMIGPTVWTSAVVSQFSVSLGLAMAVTLAGLGASSFLAPILAEYFIEHSGWRGAYVILPSIWCVILLPLTVLLFHGPTDGRADVAAPVLIGHSVREGFRSSYFWRLVFAPAIFTFGLMALVVHFVEIVTESGLDRGSAAVAVGIVGIASIVGRLVAGFLLDRVHGRYIAATMFIMPLFSVALLFNFDGTMLQAMIAASLLGLALGAEVDVLGYLLTRYLGTRYFSTFFAILMALANVAAGLGSYAAGVMYDLGGGYASLLWMLVPMFLASAAIMASLGRYPDLGRRLISTEPQAD